jgi:hypothetical protein
VKDILPKGTGVRNKNSTVANEIIALTLNDIRGTGTTQPSSDATAEMGCSTPCAAL